LNTGTPLLPLDTSHSGAARGERPQEEPQANGVCGGVEGKLDQRLWMATAQDLFNNPDQTDEQ